MASEQAVKQFWDREYAAQVMPPQPRCHAGIDGDCIWESCPQLRDRQVHCPLDQNEDDE